MENNAGFFIHYGLILDMIKGAFAMIDGSDPQRTEFDIGSRFARQLLFPISEF